MAALSNVGNDIGKRAVRKALNFSGSVPPFAADGRRPAFAEGAAPEEAPSEPISFRRLLLHPSVLVRCAVCESTVPSDSVSAALFVPVVNEFAPWVYKCRKCCL